MSTNKHEMFITIIINVIFISIFIGIFFFTYGAYIEKRVVKNQMKLISSDLIGYVNLLGNTTKEIVKSNINNINLPDMTKEDEDVKKNNINIIKLAIKANIIFIILILGLVYYTYSLSNKEFLIKEIVIKNLIILFFVGLTEFTFLTWCGSRFISIDPNQIKLAILKNLKNLT